MCFSDGKMLLRFKLGSQVYLGNHMFVFLYYVAGRITTWGDTIKKKLVGGEGVRWRVQSNSN